MNTPRQKSTEKVWAKVPLPVRIAIEAVAERRDQTVSHVTKRILELDPIAIKEYREALREARAA